MKFSGNMSNKYKLKIEVMLALFVKNSTKQRKKVYFASLLTFFLYILQYWKFTSFLIFSFTLEPNIFEFSILNLPEL